MRKTPNEKLRESFKPIARKLRLKWELKKKFIKKYGKSK